ncbi:MAG: tRNA (N6-threonylcarbamoyladenosine(37)-N6)-methyltransferase TrmO [Chloroflexi bacterium]|nr:tRNA (N6-threonylcarbamoyladenosine(37)-N6)-methyltransferase TrmO [Chloroflexota bacterium]
MQKDNAPIVLRPIGYVNNSIDASMEKGWEEIVSELVLDPDLEEATEGLEKFSHIIVVFWMHQVPREKGVPTKVHPRRRADLPLVGLFATRAPTRPNPLGISVVRLLERRRNVLKVKGLDALNGTPILDIKSYFPIDESGVTVPQWARRL